MEENKNSVQGWKDVYIDGNSPLGMLIDFINVINNRIVTIEDNTFVDYEGEKITLTEMYKREAQKELDKRNAEQAQNEVKSESNVA